MFSNFRYPAISFALLVALIAVPSLAFAASCAEVEKALEAGMKQKQIYAASFEQLPDGKPGKALLSAITIDNTHYLFEGSKGFGATPLESEAMRQMGSGLVGFAPGESCTAQGTATVAGRPAQKFSYSSDLGNGPANITLWVDRASGLPVRGIADEPEVDVDVSFSKDGDMNTTKRPTGKRSKHTSGFLYGAAVKAPMKNVIDREMQKAVMELLK